MKRILFSSTFIICLLSTSVALAESELLPSLHVIGGIPILRSSMLSKNKDFYDGLDKLNEIAKNYPFEKFPFRTIFVSNSFYECNEKGDIWVNFSAGNKQIQEYLTQSISNCKVLSQNSDRLESAVGNLKILFRQKYGTRVEMSPSLTSLSYFLDGMTKALIAFEDEPLEFGRITHLYIGDSELVTKNSLWIDFRSTSDDIKEKLKGFKSVLSPLSQSGGRSQDI
ncbi:MAG: hypothetical protein KDD25_07785 [Bdellovibrionales bacterium]|nr:hypothetical protein [Bdellovibrionales bacterium]